MWPLKCSGGVDFPMINNPFLRLTIGMAVPIASALVMEQLPKTGVAEVPFAFQVEQQTLPAGTYSVQEADLGRAFRIQNKKVANAGLKCAAAKRKFGRAQEARLVFANHGGRYRLSEIWFDADGRGLVLPESRVEEQAKAGCKPELQGIRYVQFQ